MDLADFLEVVEMVKRLEEGSFIQVFLPYLDTSVYQHLLPLTHLIEQGILLVVQLRPEDHRQEVSVGYEAHVTKVKQLEHFGHERLFYFQGQ